MLLGSYAFTAGTAGTAGNVTLTDKANGTVIADAVKVVATSGGTTSEVVRYLHSDHLNTPRLATNAQAQVIWRWEGMAFGDTYPNEDVDGDGRLTTVNLRFPGQYYDAESGLHYNWNRYYDPRIGRYVTSDPVGLRGGLNGYAYVNNNPERWKDRKGLESFPGDPGPGADLPGVPGSCQGDGCVDPIIGLPPLPSGPASCMAKCNFWVGLACGSLATGLTETGPGAAAAFIICRAAVAKGCSDGCGGASPLGSPTGGNSPGGKPSCAAKDN